jgi:BON domain
MKALEKDRDLRFASAYEMREGLQALAPGLPTSPLVVASAAPAAPPADTPVRSPRESSSHAPAATTVPGDRPAASHAGARPRSRIWLSVGLVAIAVALWVGLGRSGQAPLTPKPAASTNDAAASAEKQPVVAPAIGERTGDDAVLAEVKRLVAGSSALRGARIEIAVANGIVTLSGEAPTATTRDLAVSLAGTARGVTRVFSVIEVRPALVASPPEAKPSPSPPQPAAGGSEPPPPHL